MSDILERIINLETGGALPWLEACKAANLPALTQATWPTRKTEDWKYTHLKAVATGGYFDSPSVEASIENIDSLKALYHIDGLSTHLLVFVNGALSKPLSSPGELPEGVELLRFSDASPAQADEIASCFDRIVDNDKHLFSSINKHMLNDGVYLKVAKNVVVSLPIQVVWVTTAEKSAFHISQRMLACIEDNAEVTLVEQFVSSAEEQNCLTNSVTELYLANGARMHHYRLHQEGQEALHIGGVHASLDSNAYLNSFHLALGSELKRIDIVINHEGPGANCILNGVYLPQQNQHIDYHTCIEHRMPHCTTSENFRGIVGGNGRAVFNGRIHIHKDAQKSLAELSNKNLLLSNKGEVDSKPELEIYADDVKCAHGTTIAQLDDGAMHYFKTRGIDEQKAKVMLSFGFIQELIKGVDHPEMVDYLTPLLAKFFSEDSSLAGE